MRTPHRAQWVATGSIPRASLSLVGYTVCCVAQFHSCSVHQFAPRSWFVPGQPTLSWQPGAQTRPRLCCSRRMALAVMYLFLLSFRGPRAFWAPVLLTRWEDSPRFRLPQSPPVSKQGYKSIHQ